MPTHQRVHAEKQDDEARREKSSRHKEGHARKAPGAASLSPAPLLGDPIPILNDPKSDHRANASLRAQAVTELQTQRGNAGAQRLLSSRAIQPKLSVGPSDDAYELARSQPSSWCSLCYSRLSPKFRRLSRQSL
jgi:hypothetical protein